MVEDCSYGREVADGLLGFTRISTLSIKVKS